MALTQFAPGLWTISHPLKNMGMQFGTRTTILRLDSGALVLHSPGPLDKAHCEAIDALGEVEILIAPNLWHHLFIGKAKERWPRAKMWAPEGLSDKRSDLAIDVVMQPTGQIGDAIYWQRINGAPMVNEHVFCHRTSKSLVLADLCFNFRDHPQWFLRTIMSMLGAYNKFGPSKLLKSTFKDRLQVRESLLTILDWEWDGITLAHGQQINSGGKELLREAFAYLLES